MITQSTVLTCKFKDTLGATRSIQSDQLNENITTEQINNFMQAAIDSNMLIMNDKNPDTSLNTVEEASITNKTVAPLDLH